MALAGPGVDEFDLTITFIDRSAQGAIGKMQAEHMHNFVRDHWRDQNGGYVNSGNRENLTAIIEGL